MGEVVKIILQITLLVVILGTLGVSIASLIFVLDIQDTQNDLSKTTPQVLLAPEPIQSLDPKYGTYNSMSNLLKSWMDTSKDPCNDFYSFTCGAGVKGQGMSFDASDDSNNDALLKLLNSDSYFNSASEPMKEMKYYYDACVKKDYTDDDVYARSKRIFQDLRDKTGAKFPALFKNEEVKNVIKPKELSTLLGYSIGSQGVTSLVDIGVDTNWKNPHNSNGGYSLLIDQPATFFSSTVYAKIWTDDNINATIDGVVDILRSAAKLMDIKDFDINQAYKDATAIVDLDYSLATKYSTDDTTRRQYERSYNPYTVSSLNSFAPFLDWNEFLSQSLPKSINANVDANFTSIVMETYQLQKLSNAIASGSIDPATLNNYIFIVNLGQLTLPDPDKTTKLRNFGSHILSSLRRDRRPINRKIRREPRNDIDLFDDDDTKRQLSCASGTMNSMMWANTRLFIDSVYPNPNDRDSIRKEVNSVVRSILVGFRAQIDTLDWMTSASKKGAYQKIDNLVVNIAYPDWVLDDDKLTDYYKLLDIKSTDKYLDILDKLNDFGLYESFAPLTNGVPADRTDFSGPSAITNAWYQPEVNSITFPGGILHAPFYDVNYPAAINFGSMGVIAGHELTHGFDDQGVQWEGTGILNGWMDNSSLNSFTDMANCVVKEYSSFCPKVNGDNFCVDGAQTQGENIADNGGIHAAYNAFKAYEALNGPDPLLPGDASIFTSDQLFFLGFAQVWCQYPPSDNSLLRQLLLDPHSPSLYRVLGTIQNFPAFQKAFNCPANSVYTPSTHCDVWTSEPTSGAPLNNRGEPNVPLNDVNIAPVDRITPEDMNKYNAYQESLSLLKSSANMDLSPCDDFYHYACDTYPGTKNTFHDLDTTNAAIINDKLLDPNYQETINSSLALTKLQTLYNTCKSEQANPTINTNNYIQPKVLQMQSYLQQDIPILGGTGIKAPTPKELGSTLSYLSFVLGIDTFVTPMADTYWKDPVGKGYQLFVDQMTSVNVRAFYEDGTWDQKKPGYVEQVKTLLKAYADMDSTTKLADDYEKQINETLDFEQHLVIMYTNTDDQRRIYDRQWLPKKRADAPKGIDWNEFYSLAPQEVIDWTTTDKDVVFNEFQLTSDMLNTGLQNYEKEIVNYLFIRLLLANTGVIPCASGECMTVIKSLSAKDIPTSTGKNRVPHRPYVLHRMNDIDDGGIGCADELSAMADAQGRVYIDARFPTPDDRKKVKDTMNGVITNIIDAMKGMITQLDWMQSDSKTKALNKAEGVQINVAFPDYILDNGQLDDGYKNLNFSDTDSYFDMLDKITLFNIQNEYALLTVPTAKRDDFLGQTSVVNAWYQPELNSITFPAGILQQPYFDVNYPSGLNYGAIGIVAGHELTHGFDDEGVQWDFDGRLNSWMDGDSQDGFNKMAECVIEQYDQYCPLPSNYTPSCTDGVRTQGENIADNGGIHAAWRAYENHLELDGPDPLFMDRVYSQYTESQLFFLNFAQVWCTAKSLLTVDYVSGRLMTDPHSLGPYRVLGSLQNMPAFRVNYNCPLGSIYAPAEHCNVWVPNKMA